MTITAERLRELLDYDPETGTFRWKVQRAYVVMPGERAGCVKRSRHKSHGPHRVIIVDRKEVQEHVAAWVFIHGEWPQDKIVHVDGDRCNNRPSNLTMVDRGSKDTVLTIERLRSVLDYSPDDGRFRWKVHKDTFLRPGDLASTGTNADGYTSIRVDGVAYKAHRLAWFYVHGRWPTEQIDHINGERADNRIANLREAGRPENAKNRKRNVNNKSGFKGVHPLNGGWAAQIRVNGNRHHLGTFTTPSAAAAAYREAAQRLHGDFARIE